MAIPAHTTHRLSPTHIDPNLKKGKTAQKVWPAGLLNCQGSNQFGACGKKMGFVHLCQAVMRSQCSAL